ncbi:GNAT family N-acetyltransferase [Streptomyces sparsogenes]|uniref:GNAT family N-acetyltransferase n=1 Tax=Streptomyces sparsogenes TaxID=67365 RepID=UPI00331A930C
MEPRVTDNPEQSRFEIFDGESGELAGFAEYERSNDQVAFTHTEIAPRFEGRGLGGRLVRGALDSAREAHLEVLPYCSFVRSWIGKHPEYIALVPEDRRPRFQL